MFLLGQKEHILANIGRKTLLGAQKKTKKNTLLGIQERALSFVFIYVNIYYSNSLSFSKVELVNITKQEKIDMETRVKFVRVVVSLSLFLGPKYFLGAVTIWTF